MTVLKPSVPEPAPAVPLAITVVAPPPTTVTLSVVVLAEAAETRSRRFAVALTVKDNVGFSRADFCQYLESNKIQTRPYFAGNIMLQPAYEGIMDSDQVINDFPVARKVTTDTLFLGCSPVITEDQIAYIKTIVDNFFKTI